MQLPRQHRHPAVEVPSATAVLTACSLGRETTVTPGGSWLACTAAAVSWGEAPETPMWTTVALAAGEGQPQDGRHEQRCGQATDENGAIAQPAVELVPAR